MQYADIHLRTVLQTIQQRFAHQRVVAEPEPVRIQGREKQIVPGYPRQHRLSVAFPGHGIAQRRMQAVEYCGSQKKVQHPGGQWRKDHLFQVAREGAGSGIQLAKAAIFIPATHPSVRAIRRGISCGSCAGEIDVAK